MAPEIAPCRFRSARVRSSSSFWNGARASTFASCRFDSSVWILISSSSSAVGLEPATTVVLLPPPNMSEMVAAPSSFDRMPYLHFFPANASSPLIARPRGFGRAVRPVGRS